MLFNLHFAGRSVSLLKAHCFLSKWSSKLLFLSTMRQGNV